jgi:AraC-like DNA-binding protein
MDSSKHLQPEFPTGEVSGLHNRRPHLSQLSGQSLALDADLRQAKAYICRTGRPEPNSRKARDGIPATHYCFGDPVTNHVVNVDSAVSDYREYSPPLPLATHLVCLWTQTILGSGEAFTQRVMPDGCVDIVLINDEAPTVIGPWTVPFDTRLAAGTTIVGARCRPGLARNLLGLPASVLLNQSVPLRDVWGSATSFRFERITDERTLSARKSAMEIAMLEHLSQGEPVDETMSAAIRWLSKHPHGRIQQLSEWIGLSSRQLQRRFISAVGYGPKMFQSVLRFQRLLNLSGSTSVPRGLARVSADAGYADQAHMTREVQRFSGSPPTVLLGSTRCALRLSDLLNTTGGEDR